MLFVFSTLLSLSAAHMRMMFQPAMMPVRNAQTPNGDGQYSTDSNCGGVGTWGQNGATTVFTGSTVTINFNYGTGTSGDHAGATNNFTVHFVNLDQNQTTPKDLSDASNMIAGPIPSAAGSTQIGYTATVMIPNVLCSKCVLAVYEYPHSFSACIDVTVISGMPTPPTPAPSGWTLGLPGYTASTCAAQSLTWFSVNSTTVTDRTISSWCCAAGDYGCNGTCWNGAAPLTMNGVQIFADESLCYDNLLCNGTLLQAICRYTLNGQPLTTCKDSCDRCTSLCQTSATVGYADCQCTGSNAVSHSLALLVAVIAAMLAVL